MTGAQVRAALNNLAKQYNVKDYGAVGNGVTDDTVAIQACMNAAQAAGGGDVYFPNGIYVIGGALQTSIDGANPNCQLYFKQPATQYATRVGIRLIGESSLMYHISGNYGPSIVYAKGVILKSTLSSASGTNPSVIGGGDATKFVSDIITFENITVECKSTASGPVLTGINAGYIDSSIFRNVCVAIDVAGGVSNEPTNECAGILAGPVANSCCVMERVTVAGFKYGIVACEHLSIANVLIYCCAYAFVIPLMHYTVVANILTIHWCKHGIYSPQAAVMGISNGMSYINLASVEFEMNIASGKWYDQVASILDAGNYIYGKIRYILYQSGGGTPSWADYVQTGGTHIDVKKVTEA